MPSPADLKDLKEPVLTSYSILVNLKTELPQVKPSGRGFNPNSGSISTTISIAVPQLPEYAKVEEDGSLTVKIIDLRRKMFLSELRKVASWMDIFKAGFRAGSLVKSSEVEEFANMLER